MTAQGDATKTLPCLRTATEGALDRLSALEVSYYLGKARSAEPPALHLVSPELATLRAVKTVCAGLGRPGGQSLCELIVGATTAARTEPLRRRAADCLRQLGRSAGNGPASSGAADWEAAYDDRVAPLRLMALDMLDELLQEVGFAGRAWYTSHVLRHDLRDLCGAAHRFLDITAGLYWSSLGGGLPRGSLVAMVRATMPESLQGVSVNDGVAAAKGLLRGLNLSLASQIRLDVEKRPGKVPGAYSLPVRVPGEIVIAVTPGVGSADFRGLIHEWGHAMHFSSIRADLPVELRRLGDSGLVEGWGAFTEMLTLRDRWLQETLEVPVSRDMRHHNARRLLAVSRVKALQVLFAASADLHEHPASLRSRYAALLRKHTGLSPRRSEYVDVLASNYDAATRLRSWGFGLAVQDLLVDQFGPQWTSSPAAGDWLRAVWSEGAPNSAEDTVVKWGGRRPHLGRLAAELQSLLHSGDNSPESSGS